MMRLNNPDDAANFMSSKAAGTSDTQRLKPQLGIIMLYGKKLQTSPTANLMPANP